MLGKRASEPGLGEAERVYLAHVGPDSFYGFLAGQRGQLLRRQRRVEVVGHADAPAHPTERARAGLKRDQPGNRFAAPRDDDLLTALDPLDELGEAGLRLVDVDRSHRDAP